MTDNKTPRVSVIIPAYNAEGCIGRAVKSVQDQTEQDFEIVIVDDCSKDQTVETVRTLQAKDPRIVLLQAEVNGGPSAARNIGFEAARGRWLAILDADDSYKPTRLKLLCDHAEAQNLDAIGDDLVLYDELADVEVGAAGFVRKPGLSLLSLDEYLDTTTYRVGLKEALRGEDKLISVLKFVFRADFVRQHALKYTRKYRYCEDFIMYYDLLRAGARVGLLNEPLYVYTEQVGTISGRASPHTRTVADRTSIIEATDEILRRDQGLTPRQRRLLEQRSRSVSLNMEYQALRQRLKSGKKLGFIAGLSVRPNYWLLFLREVRMAVTARLG